MCQHCNCSCQPLTPYEVYNKAALRAQNAKDEAIEAGDPMAVFKYNYAIHLAREAYNEATA